MAKNKLDFFRTVLGLQQNCGDTAEFLYAPCPHVTIRGRCELWCHPATWWGGEGVADNDTEVQLAFVLSSSLLRQQTIKVSEIQKKSDLLKGVFQKAMGRAEEGCGI